MERRLSVNTWVNTNMTKKMLCNRSYRLDNSSNCSLTPTLNRWGELYEYPPCQWQHNQSPLDWCYSFNLFVYCLTLPFTIQELLVVWSFVCWTLTLLCSATFMNFCGMLWILLKACMGKDVLNACSVYARPLNNAPPLAFWDAPWRWVVRRKLMWQPSFTIQSMLQ